MTAAHRCLTTKFGAQGRRDFQPQGRGNRAATKATARVPGTRAISGWPKPHGRNHFTSVGDRSMINPLSHVKDPSRAVRDESRDRFSVGWRKPAPDRRPDNGQKFRLHDAKKNLAWESQSERKLPQRSAISGQTRHEAVPCRHPAM